MSWLSSDYCLLDIIVTTVCVTLFNEELLNEYPHSSKLSPADFAQRVLMVNIVLVTYIYVLQVEGMLLMMVGDML